MRIVKILAWLDLLNSLNVSIDIGVIFFDNLSSALQFFDKLNNANDI